MDKDQGPAAGHSDSFYFWLIYELSSSSLFVPDQIFFKNGILQK